MTDTTSYEKKKSAFLVNFSKVPSNNPLPHPQNNPTNLILFSDKATPRAEPRVSICYINTLWLSY